MPPNWLSGDDGSTEGECIWVCVRKHGQYNVTQCVNRSSHKVVVNICLCKHILPKYVQAHDKARLKTVCTTLCPRTAQHVWATYLHLNLVFQVVNDLVLGRRTLQLEWGNDAAMLEPCVESVASKKDAESRYMNGWESNQQHHSINHQVYDNIL